MYNTKTYAVINIADISLIDFSQVGESSVSTVRKSLDETLFVIKWSSAPSFITDLTVVPVSENTHQEILTLMSSAAWQ